MVQVINLSCDASSSWLGLGYDKDWDGLGLGWVGLGWVGLGLV